jgi:hypothetical protein
VREQARLHRQAVAPTPTIENGVRQWASPALLRWLKPSGETGSLRNQTMDA